MASVIENLRIRSIQTDYNKSNNYVQRSNVNMIFQCACKSNFHSIFGKSKVEFNFSLQQFLFSGLPKFKPGHWPQLEFVCPVSFVNPLPYVRILAYSRKNIGIQRLIGKAQSILIGLAG